VEDRMSATLLRPPHLAGGHISELAKLLEALRFAADRHRAQRRKDVDASPYINHPIEVATILATVGRVTNMTILIAAVLHDTIEDTKTAPKELEKRFGRAVRALVLEVTDDKRLPKRKRKRLQIEHAPMLSDRAKVIKLGDMIANVQDVKSTPPAAWSLKRRREYLDWTKQVVRGCRGANPALERRYDKVLRAGRASLRGRP
jgi:guanosine-3',5'-bis(diphosphate) 3'-pyrophosphohydrolase